MIENKNEILYYENISFIREKREILKDVNWKIEKGENWALLGLNGSGKSTLLEMVLAYVFPTKGELRVFGHKFGNYAWKNIKNRVGFVSSSLNNFLSTLNKQKLEDIVVSGKFNSIGVYEKIYEKDVEKANKIIKNFKIEYLKGKYFSTFSQGEQRRTLLARAFMNEPDLLILDEPCSGLDITSREYLLNTLEENSKCKKSKISFIYVTHQIEEIIPSITHVAILKNGEMKVKGLKKEILTDEILTELFEIPVRIEWENERPWLIVK